MILDQSRNKEQQDLQLSTNLTSVFVLYITLPVQKYKTKTPSKSVSVCYSYVPVCYSYVTRMYPYVPVCSVCYKIFYTNNRPIPTNYLKEMLRPILQEKIFPIYRKRLPSDTRHRNGNKNGSFFRRHFYGKDRNRNNKPLH